MPNISTAVEPTSYVKTIKDASWHEAIHTELQAIEQNNTYTIIDFPFGKTPVRCKWIVLSEIQI